MLSGRGICGWERGSDGVWSESGSVLSRRRICGWEKESGEVSASGGAVSASGGAVSASDATSGRRVRRGDLVSESGRVGSGSASGAEGSVNGGVLSGRGICGWERRSATHGGEKTRQYDAHFSGEVMSGWAVEPVSNGVWPGLVGHLAHLAMDEESTLLSSCNGTNHITS